MIITVKAKAYDSHPYPTQEPVQLALGPREGGGVSLEETTSLKSTSPHRTNVREELRNNL